MRNRIVTTHVKIKQVDKHSSTCFILHLRSSIYFLLSLKVRYFYFIYSKFARINRFLKIGPTITAMAILTPSPIKYGITPAMSA